MSVRRWLGLLGVTFLAGCGGLAPGSVTPADIPDPTTLARTGSPNDWLLCPTGACRARPRRRRPPTRSRRPRCTRRGRQSSRRSRGCTVIAEDAPRLLLMVQDRTPLLRFVDTVTIRVLPAADGGSTFAAYSRSNVGVGDLGTNRRRLERWLAALAQEVAPQP